MKAIILIVCLLFFSFTVGCGRTPGPGASPAPTQGAPGATNPAGVTPDAVSSPSVVVDEASLVKAMGNEGTWIIIFTGDFSTNKELVLEGEYTNGKKDDAGKDIIQRKIALYTQDDKRNITNRFTLTAPKLTVTSPMASIQHGTFKGDLVVSVDNFQLVDATVDGNVYFTTDSAKSTFSMDEKSKITGKQEVRKD
jgi:hypothetical protein